MMTNQPVTLPVVVDLLRRYFVALDQNQAWNYYHLRKRLREIADKEKHAGENDHAVA